MQWAEELKKEYEKIAKANMSKRGKVLRILKTLNTRETIAEDLGMGKTTYCQAQFIKDNASEELRLAKTC